MNWAKHCARVAKGKSGFPIIEIVWKDAVAFAVNWEEKATTKLRLCTSVGYLVAETDEAYSIVSLINSEQVGHGIVISKSSMVRMRICGVE